MCGKICLDEVQRIRRVARQDCVKMPNYLRDVEKYKHQLRHIANINGLCNYPNTRRRHVPKRVKSVTLHSDSSRHVKDIRSPSEHSEY